MLPIILTIIGLTILTKMFMKAPLFTVKLVLIGLGLTALIMGHWIVAIILAVVAYKA